MVRLLTELDFAHVERPDTSDRILLVDHRRRFTLGFGKDDVDEVLKDIIFQRIKITVHPHRSQSMTNKSRFGLSSLY